QERQKEEAHAAERRNDTENGDGSEGRRPVERCLEGKDDPGRERGGPREGRRAGRPLLTQRRRSHANRSPGAALHAVRSILSSSTGTAQPCGVARGSRLSRTASGEAVRRLDAEERRGPS